MCDSSAHSSGCVVYGSNAIMHTSVHTIALYVYCIDLMVGDGGLGHIAASPASPALSSPQPT